MSSSPLSDPLHQAGHRTGEFAAPGLRAATAWLNANISFARAGITRRSLDLSGPPARIVIGAVTVLIPALLLVFLAPGLPVTTPGVVLLAAVALSTYFADWAGGISALLVCAAVLDLLFLEDRQFASIPRDGEEATGILITLAVGLGLVWLIQRIKGEGFADRQAAVAARAAAAALTSLESATARHAVGSSADRLALHSALLRTMVTVNRAHTGLLYLTEPGEPPTRVATYGVDTAIESALVPDDLADGMLARIATERRTWAIEDVQNEARCAGLVRPGSRIRALLCVPILGFDGHLLGIAAIGLLVEHRFSRTEIARAEALASRTAAILQAAAGIDERELALTSAREAKRWLETVIAAMPEAVVLAMPPDGMIVAENQAAIDLLGRQTGLPGHAMPRLLLPDGNVPAEGDLPVHAAIATGGVIGGMELLIERADGSRVPVLVSAAPVQEPNGEIHAIVAVFRDIHALKEASRLKDEFVSVVSHELRSPLTPIRGFVQLVARDLAKEGGHIAHVDRLNSIAGHVDRMTRLVDDLLDVSRLKSGSLEIRSTPTDLATIARDVVGDRLASAMDHPILLETDSEIILGDWDPDRLYQIVDNLVGNAIKYTPPGGAITIRTGVDALSGDATLAVEDRGPGILANDRHRIFSAFYRTRDATESHIAGLGLGLFICHELVAAHGGTIEVGDAPEGGAAFTIRLPRSSRAIAA